MRLAFLLGLALGLPGNAHARESLEWLLYGGIQAQDGWQDVIKNPANNTYYDDGLVGAALSGSRQIGQSPVAYGFEVQANYHFGGEDYTEFNFPVFLRYQPGWKYPFRGLAFGLGPSVTTQVPDIEVDKGGASQNVLFYWYIEAAFGRAGARNAVILRLHHRSNGFDTFEKPGSSNAVVLGLRRRF